MARLARTTVAQHPEPLELNARILRPLLWYTEERLGADVAVEVHRRARVAIEVFEEDSSWLSHEAFERLIKAYRAAIGTTKRFAEACVHDNRRAYGSLLVAFPFLTGRQAYEALARTMRLVSKISHYEVEVASSGRDLTLRYFSQRAESRLMCLTRRAQLPTLPLLVGLPAAQVQETSCVARGDPCCTYQVRIRQQNRWAVPVVGAGLGLISAIVLPRAAMSPAVSLWLLPVLGLVLGAVVDLGRRFLAQRRLLLEARRQSEQGLAGGLGAADSNAQTGNEDSPSNGTPATVDREAHTLTSGETSADREVHQRAMPVPGSQVDRYEILSRAGRGGMGMVFAARDTKLGRRVALKLLHRYGQPEDLELARLVREGQALATLDHPNVVTVYDVGEWEDTLFLVMEFVEGVTLKEWAMDPANTKLERTIAVLLQAAEGLAAAHGAGLIHRDFKPSNVLVGGDGRVRVADFGLARRTEAERERLEPRSTSRDDLDASPQEAVAQAAKGNVTETGQVMGTPRYMAPEQSEGRRLDPRCDQFSFCVVAYELLCGVHPFAEHPDEDFYTAAKTMARSEPQRDVPQAVLNVLSRGMAPSRPRRFRSMQGLVSALRTATQKKPPPRLPWFFRRRKGS